MHPPLVFAFQRDVFEMHPCGWGSGSGFGLVTCFFHVVAEWRGVV